MSVQRIFWSLAAGAALAFAAPSAFADTWNFHQTGSTPPGVFVQASFTLNPALGGMPSLDSDEFFSTKPGYVPPPVDFGGLTAFTISLSSSAESDGYTLADFGPPQAQGTSTGYFWSINDSAFGGGPGEIVFSSGGGDQFTISDLRDASEGISDLRWDGTIQINTDGPTPCFNQGGCQVAGYWAVPEPPSVLIFATGLLLLGLVVGYAPEGWRRRINRAAPRSAASPADVSGGADLS